VTTADIKHVVAIWRTRKKALAGAKRGAVAERHLKQAARHLFNWAIEEGYATRTPFRSPQGVSLIHIATTKGRKRRLQDGEEARLLEAADPFIKDFFAAMLETGCRPGELRTLQWSEVREDHFLVMASKAKDREDRLVPIEPTLQKILKGRKLGPDGRELAPDRYVFGNETGEQLSRARLCALWRDVCKSAKVHDLHLHDLRAEFASQLSESKVSVEQVRDALGHSNISMTSTYLRSHAKSLTKAYKQRTAHRARQAMKRVV
jgi:integrase